MVNRVLASIKLLLPALFPSWRFFDAIGPSPRVEYSLLESEDGSAEDWREFRPRPERLSALDMLRRLVWNPRWNESLYLVTCAERLIRDETEHAEWEIRARILTEIARTAGMGGRGDETPFLVFRLVFLNREGPVLHREVIFVSQPHPVAHSVAHPVAHSRTHPSPARRF